MFSGQIAHKIGYSITMACSLCFRGMNASGIVLLVHCGQNCFYRSRVIEVYSESCLERPLVRATAQDKSALFTYKINMICKALAIEIISFCVFWWNYPARYILFRFTLGRPQESVLKVAPGRHRVRFFPRYFIWSPTTFYMKKDGKITRYKCIPFDSASFETYNTMVEVLAISDIHRHIMSAQRNIMSALLAHFVLTMPRWCLLVFGSVLVVFGAVLVVVGGGWRWLAVFGGLIDPIMQLNAWFTLIRRPHVGYILFQWIFTKKIALR